LTLDENEIARLRCLIGSRSNCLELLGYVVDLDSREVHDSLRGSAEIADREFEAFQILLSHYSKAERVRRGGRLVKFADLSGGHAYEDAFLRRAVQPIAETFGNLPEKLLERAEAFSGVFRNYGDCAVEISALPNIPLVIIMWRADEFPASATILFDESANCYLPTEDLAVLGELTAARLVMGLKNGLR